MALSETSMRVGPLMIETATIALEGELVSGDRACVSESDAGVLVSVVDGLGHGQQASNASTQACEVLRSGPSDSLAALVQRCHQKLRGTRGAVVALAFFPAAAAEMEWLAVGNIEGALVRSTQRAGGREMIVQRPGIVGHRLPALRSATHPIGPGDTLVLATDGVDRRLVQALSGGAAARGDGAAALLRQFATGKDDALLVLVRYQPESAIRGNATAVQTIECRYRAGLGTYLASAQEAALLDAYELGREIMDSGGGLLDLSAVHQAALQRSIMGTGLASDRSAASRAHEFLSEALAPFEMAQRGFREANVRLRSANEQLARRSEQLAAVIASINDGLVVADASGAIMAVNARAAKLLGADRESLVGQDAETVATLLAARCERNAALDELRTQLHDRLAGSSTFELRASAPERDLLIELFAVRGDPQPGIGVMLRDVTAERDLARAKDELVAIVSHELRSPLSSMIGFAQLLLLDRNETEAEELQMIVDEGRRLAQLIDDFLDLQRIDRGAIRIEPRDLKLASVIDALGPRLPDDPRHPQTVDLPGDLPAVWADHERILQVLINLVINARKYSPDGGPVHLSATVCDDAVKVTVADTGLGLERDAIPNLFVEFYRVQTPDRHGITGTGLGLSICKKIIHAHGGEIWAESEGRGNGSRFHFTLPIAAVDTDSRARTTGSTARSSMRSL